MPDSGAEGRVYVVDDDADVRDSLAALLDVSGFDVQTFSTGQEFLSAMTSERRGCVLLDVRLPDMNGLDVLATLSEIGVRLPVVVITAYADVPLAVAAMRAGAADFLEKPYSENVLLASVEAALQRNAAEAAAVEDVRRINSRLSDLTPREREVLDRLLVGRQNKQIAYDLGISPRTVEIHRARVMEKMAAGSLSELVRQVLAVRGNIRGIR